MNRLTCTQIKYINASICDTLKLPYTCAEHVIDRIVESLYYFDCTGDYHLLRHIPDKAARLAFEIATKKPFQHCNTKTAYISFITFLMLNGFLLDFDNEKLKVVVSFFRDKALIERDLSKWAYLNISD